MLLSHPCLPCYVPMGAVSPCPAQCGPLRTTLQGPEPLIGRVCAGGWRSSPSGPSCPTFPVAFGNQHGKPCPGTYGLQRGHLRSPLQTVPMPSPSRRCRPLRTRRVPATRGVGHFPSSRLWFPRFSAAASSGLALPAMLPITPSDGASGSAAGSLWASGWCWPRPGPHCLSQPGQSSAEGRGLQACQAPAVRGHNRPPSSPLRRQAAAARSARPSHKLKHSLASGSGSQVFQVDFPSRKERHK